MNPELSIIVAGIRPQNWIRLYESIISSMCELPFELIIGGPYDPPAELLAKDNFRFIRDFSCPTRCTMITALAAKAPLITWMADDGYYFPNVLKNTVNYWKTHSDPRHVINLRYNEGPNFVGAEKPLDYWMCHFHALPRSLPGVLPHHKLLLMGMIHREYFYEMGGFDCRYEYLNLNLQDLGIRIQKESGIIELSSEVILTVDWVSDEARLDEYGTSDATIDAFHHNDLPLFISEYSTPNNRIKIDYSNWMDAAPIWMRRKFNNINQHIKQ